MWAAPGSPQRHAALGLDRARCSTVRCVEISVIVRALRRHAGLSQRELAEQLDVSPAAVAAWEKGSRRPPFPVLDAALASFGLDLTLCLRATPAPEELRRYLALPLTSRLRLLSGEHPSPYRRAEGPAWTELRTLARHGTAVLQLPSALAMWLPGRPREQISLPLHLPKRDVPQCTAVHVSTSADPPPKAVVPVTVEGPDRVWVLPPAE